MADVQRKRNELRYAIVELRERGLHSAAKWTAEQLVGLPKDSIESTSDTESMAGEKQKDSTLGQDVESRLSIESVNEGSKCRVDFTEDEDAFFLGKSYFDCREYLRAAHALQPCKGNKAIFLRNYSLFLAGERRKEEENIENFGPLGRSDSSNNELSAVEESLRSAFLDGKLDAFGTYLYALLLRQKSRTEEAKQMLCSSVHSFPWNWSAWLQLQELCSDSSSFHSLLPQLPDHWVRSFWEASVLLDHHQNVEGLALYRELKAQFPHSDNLAAQTAMAHYNLRQFDDAQEEFEAVMTKDPYRVDNMDVYSNILYVKELSAALSFLAHKAILTDKYRPETCCIVGNYFSLKSQHERAVLYFKRALKLNRNYLSAWTLMGHEFVEMKNTQAAIHAYRHAVDINARDYRAWYGLGQAYEILAMPHYALFYYRKACQLRPKDARMWCAMGQCYQSEGLQQYEAAIRCYKNSVQYNDNEGLALNKLAKLYASLGQNDHAADYYKRDLERIEAEKAEGIKPHMEALLFLAQHMRSKGLFLQAQAYCYRLLDFGGPAMEEARAMQREIESVQMHSSPASIDNMDVTGSQ